VTLLRQGVWTGWPTEVPSNPYYSVILWFYLLCFPSVGIRQGCGISAYSGSLHAPSAFSWCCPCTFLVGAAGRYGQWDSTRHRERCQPSPRFLGETALLRRRPVRGVPLCTVLACLLRLPQESCRVQGCGSCGVLPVVPWDSAASLTSLPSAGNSCPSDRRVSARTAAFNLFGTSSSTLNPGSSWAAVPAFVGRCFQRRLKGACLENRPAKPFVTPLTLAGLARVLLWLWILQTGGEVLGEEWLWLVLPSLMEVRGSLWVGVAVCRGLRGGILGVPPVPPVWRGSVQVNLTYGFQSRELNTSVQFPAPGCLVFITGRTRGSCSAFWKSLSGQGCALAGGEKTRFTGLAALPLSRFVCG